MTAHLKLVVDNSERIGGLPRAREPRPLDRPGTVDGAGREAGPARPVAVPRRRGRPVHDPSWVHRFWAPRRPSDRNRPEAEIGRLRLSLAEDRGAVTAEYALVIMAAVAFAGLLVAIMRSGEIRQMLVDLVQNALASAG